MTNPLTIKASDHVQFHVIGQGAQWYGFGTGLFYLKLANRIWDLCKIAEGKKDIEVTKLAADILNDAGIGISKKQMFQNHKVSIGCDNDFFHYIVLPELSSAIGLKFEPLCSQGLIELVGEQLEGMNQIKLAFVLWFLYDYPTTYYYEYFLNGLAEDLKD